MLSRFLIALLLSSSLFINCKSRSSKEQLTSPMPIQNPVPSEQNAVQYFLLTQVEASSLPDHLFDLNQVSELKPMRILVSAEAFNVIANGQADKFFEQEMNILTTNNIFKSGLFSHVFVPSITFEQILLHVNNAEILKAQLLAAKLDQKLVLALQNSDALQLAGWQNIANSLKQAKSYVIKSFKHYSKPISRSSRNLEGNELSDFNFFDKFGITPSDILKNKEPFTYDNPNPDAPTALIFRTTEDWNGALNRTETFVPLVTRLSKDHHIRLIHVSQLNDIFEQISKAKTKISFIETQGHATPKFQILAKDVNLTTQTKFPDHLREKFTDDAIFVLNGCSSGKTCPNLSNLTEHIAQQVGIRVYGSSDISAGKADILPDSQGRMRYNNYNSLKENYANETACQKTRDILVSAATGMSMACLLGLYYYNFDPIYSSVFSGSLAAIGFGFSGFRTYKTIDRKEVAQLMYQAKLAPLTELETTRFARNLPENLDSATILNTIRQEQIAALRFQGNIPSWLDEILKESSDLHVLELSEVSQLPTNLSHLTHLKVRMANDASTLQVDLDKLASLQVLLVSGSAQFAGNSALTKLTTLELNDFSSIHSFANATRNLTEHKPYNPLDNMSPNLDELILPGFIWRQALDQNLQANLKHSKVRSIGIKEISYADMQANLAVIGEMYPNLSQIRVSFLDLKLTPSDIKLPGYDVMQVGEGFILTKSATKNGLSTPNAEINR